jgi:plasmid maintenance system antidote protein VapI
VEGGVSLRELARRAGVPAAVVSRFVRAERGVTFGVAAKLLAAVGLELVARNGRKVNG